MTGIWTAGEKLGLAIGPAVAGLGLAYAGFVSGATVQADSIGNSIVLLTGVGPVIFLLASLAPLLLMKEERSEMPLRS